MGHFYPTPQLRWIEKDGSSSDAKPRLQQLWSKDGIGPHGYVDFGEVSEWRDVPSIKEKRGA